MPSPFYNGIKSAGGTGAAGTGAYTPTGDAPGLRAWLVNVPPGWVGLVRYEEGADWELSYSYWNGVTLSRSANQFVASSTGSRLNLTASATAAMVVDGSEIMSHFGTTPWRGWFSAINNATPTNIGMPTLTNTGTAAAVALATTNYLTEQPRTQLTMATTTVNTQAGWSNANGVMVYSTTAGRGGGECVARWGLPTLGNGPRLLIGFGAQSWVGAAGEPSALTQNLACFGKDSGDANIQLLTNTISSGAGSKADTGIPLAANGWYESSLWCEPGGGKVSGLLIRMDTGNIWFGSTTTDLPAAAAMNVGALCGIGTAGVAAVMHIGSLAVRGGN